MSNQPIDKGRLAVVVERYQSKDPDPQSGQPVMKNRYATIGRATKWMKNNVEQIEQEIDCMPVNVSGPVKIYIFWDSQNNIPQQAGGFQQPAPTGGFQQPAPNQHHTR